MLPAGLLQIDATILQQIHGNSPQCSISIAVHMMRRVLHRLEHDPKNGTLGLRSARAQVLLDLACSCVWRRIQARTLEFESPCPFDSVLVSPRFAKPAAAAPAKIL
jgi:hypothetical protein